MLVENPFKPLVNRPLHRLLQVAQLLLHLVSKGALGLLEHLAHNLLHSCLIHSHGRGVVSLTVCSLGMVVRSRTVSVAGDMVVPSRTAVGVKGVSGRILQQSSATMHFCIECGERGVPHYV